MVYDENRSPLYDYCAAKTSGDDRFYLKADAKYLIVRAILQRTGSINTVLSLNFFEPNQSDQTSSSTTTSKPSVIDKILPKGHQSFI